MLLIDEVKEMQRLIEIPYYERSRTENDFTDRMLIRLARFQPSPSKMNAMAIYKSNPPEKVALYIESLESNE